MLLYRQFPLLTVASALLAAATPSQLAAHSNQHADLRGETGKRAVDLAALPVEVEEVADNLYRVSGIGHIFLIKTDEGSVLFDMGLANQAERQKAALLQAVDPGPIRYIILSHAHQDHVGGVPRWAKPGVEIVAQEHFPDVQRYLKELEPFLWRRNHMLYANAMEAEPTVDTIEEYGLVEPTMLVPDGESLDFTLGGRRFVVLSTPGAEGEDGLSLWLPDEKILLSGDTFGPLYPMVPNLTTIRGEKFRDPIDYVETLDKLIALEPERIFPSHFGAIEGKDYIRETLIRMRDATQYIHDETIRGMNSGKSLEELMREIKLPEELSLSEGHGKVAWNVRGIWEYYTTWFKYRSTTELYPMPIWALFPRMAELIGPAEVLAEARRSLTAGDPVRALHWLDVHSAAHPEETAGLQLRLNALERLLADAMSGERNQSEVMWLRSRIATVQGELAEQ